MGDAAEKLPDVELEPLMTVDEVAPLLRLSKKAVYNMIEDGTLTEHAGLRRFGRRVRFHRPSLVAFFAGQGSASKRRTR